MRPHGLVLEMMRQFSAPRAHVFEFFADAALLRKWWGPNGFSIPSVDLAAHAGGRYRIEMQPPDGEAFQLTGTFEVVEAPSRLAFSFQWEPADPDDRVTVAQLSFEVIDDSTRVHLVQGPFNTEARRALHRDGWMQSFDKLGRLVAAQR